MKQWLRELFDQYLANVAELTIHDRSKAEAWSGWIKAKWSEQGFQDIAAQRPLMAEVRQALQDHLGSRHIALDTLKLDDEPRLEAPSRNGKVASGRTATITLPKVEVSAKQENGAIAQWTLTTREAYDLARSRGYKGTKSQMQKRVRESPQVFMDKYGLSYRPGAVSGRYARNWSDSRSTPKERSPQVPQKAPRNVTKRLGRPPKKAVEAQLQPQTQTQQALPVTQTAQELGEAMLWFIREVDHLRQQIQELEGLADAYDPELNAHRVQEYDALVAENARLKAEHDALAQQLGHIHQVVNASAAQKPAAKQGKRASQPAVATADSGHDPYVVQALEAVMAYNNHPKRSHDEKWVISYPVMKELLKQVGASTQPKIREVFEARRDEIDAHHRTHQLTSRHNRVHGDLSISDIIHLT
ncbi:MAG: hypothetical protein EA367_06060 [Leptolyngbya sp. DLM2.Bin15]|nr:MAG: hypothetical protein EA367_06060 [Leptolyngbya sp. DLM2.Bin15]